MKFKFIDKLRTITELSREDDYLKNVSQTSLNLIGISDPDEYKRKLSQIALNWDTQTKSEISIYLDELNNRLDRLNINSDLEILISKTSGAESFGMPYTRHNVIVITSQSLSLGKSIIAHELFHILSRNNKEMRKELYKLWGFEYSPFTPINNTLTNPDAPNSDYSTIVSHNGNEKRVTPLLYIEDYSMESLKDADKKLYCDGQIINMDETNYLEVTKSPSQVSAYHPEEISAEVFRYYVLGKEIQEFSRFKSILDKYLGK